MNEIGSLDAIYSARALRRLKPDPVPEELITKVLDAAVRAPSGGNAQNWIFIVVRDLERGDRHLQQHAGYINRAQELNRSPDIGVQRYSNKSGRRCTTGAAAARMSRVFPERGG